jgi:hypothetical protein
MAKLRESLAILVDESKKIERRLDEIMEKNSPNHIKGLGLAVLTAILMCAYPCKYAVYNSISEAALKQLSEDLPSNGSLGEQYVELNKKCLELESGPWKKNKSVSNLKRNIPAFEKFKKQSDTQLGGVPTEPSGGTGDVAVIESTDVNGNRAIWLLHPLLKGNKDRIDEVHFATGGSVASIHLSTGESVERTDAPHLWPFLALLVYPTLGFLIPWGSVRLLIWVGSGFLSRP